MIIVHPASSHPIIIPIVHPTSNVHTDTVATTEVPSQSDIKADHEIRSLGSISFAVCVIWLWLYILYKIFKD